MEGRWERNDEAREMFGGRCSAVAEIQLGASGRYQLVLQRP